MEEKDLTQSHSQQFVDAQGRKHVVIKPIRIEKKYREDGTVENINVVVPRLSMRPTVRPE